MDTLRFSDTVTLSLVAEQTVNDEVDTEEDRSQNDTRIRFISEDETFEHETDQGCSVATSREPAIRAPSDDVEAPATLSKGKPATTQSSSVVTSRKNSLHPLSEALCALPLADALTRLEDVAKVQAGDVDEPVSSDHTHVTWSIDCDVAQMEPANICAVEAAEVQMLRGKGCSGEHAHHDCVSVTSECGSNQVNETTSHSPSDQSAMENDLLEQDGALANRLLVSTVEQQESRTETITSKSMIREREFTTSHDGASDRRDVKIVVPTHSKEPRMSDDNTDEALRTYECLLLKTGRTKDGCAESLQEDLPGSKSMTLRVLLGCSADNIGNPIPIDDNESPSQSTNGSIVVDNDAGNSEGDRRSASHSPGRPVRKNHKRKYSDMQPWGDIEFEQRALNELQSIWNRVKICWYNVEALVSKLRDHNHHHQGSIMKLVVAVYSFWMEWERSGSMDQTSLLELIECWKKMRAYLEAEKALEKGGEEDRLLEFEQALNGLATQAALCDSIREYPSSIDREDEDKDKEYGETRRASKTRCCRKGRQ
jgi:hypothetical protein